MAPAVDRASAGHDPRTGLTLGRGKLWTGIGEDDRSSALASRQPVERFSASRQQTRQTDAWSWGFG